MTGIPAAVKSYGMAKHTVPEQGLMNGLMNVQPEKSVTPLKKASMAAWPPMEWMPMGVGQALNQVAESNELTPYVKALSINMILDAHREKPGMMSFGQLAKAGVGAGLGVMAGTVIARALTSMLGLPAVGTQTFMRGGGGIVGGLLGGGFAA